ncbi:MAG: enoyl-CoA hydratase/isomerase family protein [Xanthomonadaceae bacterium]|nr:enoyl-CoA hydratase/isomerase family protein [Xanthomonadaceae bacterium]
MNSDKNWHIRTDDDGIAWLGFDKAGAGTNVLSGAVMRELNDRIAELEESKPKAVIVHSMKDTGFIAGADIKEFTDLKGPDDALQLIRGGQGVLERLENLRCPTVAMINGFALGGGLELALACRYRVALDDPKTQLGLPEVKLGIHPGFGGTVRSIRLVGVLPAMDMMLTGRGLRARQAKKIGLVDMVAPARHLERAARKLALNPPPVQKAPWQQRVLSSKPMRGIIASQLEKQVARKAKRRHYPAPYAIIELWKDHYDDHAEMYEQEARSIAELMTGDTARNLVRVFMLQDRLKSLGRKSKLQLSHVHVVGAGVMGGDIAAWCALRGYNVTLQDREPKYIAPAIKRAVKLFAGKLKEPRLVQAAMDRLVPDVSGRGVAQADVVIEAIFENTDAKRALYAELEPKMKDGALLATNTSSIRLEELSGALSDPNRLVGLHFFNPVAKMPLLEVVHTDDTDPRALEQALAFARHVDRLPMPAKSSPGFLVNRILMPYMMEAMLAAGEGVPKEAIDRAALDFGMPMGPVELADTVGLDVALSVSKVFEDAFDMSVPPTLKQMVDAGNLGRKSGRGFYEYKNGKPVRDRKAAAGPTDLQDRLIMPLLNEAVACLHEGVVEDAELADAGVIFGTGFAPFTGGPINYIRAQGKENILERMRTLEARHGARFAPHEGWEQL